MSFEIEFSFGTAEADAPAVSPKTQPEPLPALPAPSVSFDAWYRARPVLPFSQRDAMQPLPPSRSLVPVGPVDGEVIPWPPEEPTERKYALPSVDIHVERAEPVPEPEIPGDETWRDEAPESAMDQEPELETTRAEPVIHQAYPAGESPLLRVLREVREREKARAVESASIASVADAAVRQIESEAEAGGPVDALLPEPPPLPAPPPKLSLLDLIPSPPDDKDEMAERLSDRIERLEPEQVDLTDEDVARFTQRAHITYEMLDDSQRAAIEGMLDQQYACLMGAAGTGKSTIMKILCDRIVKEGSQLDIANYANRMAEEMPNEVKYIPSLANVAFTGRAVENLLSMLPTDYHDGTMTIHRCLAFYPVRSFSAEGDNSFLFVPWYTAENKFDWNCIVVDEAGMFGTRLAQQFFAACPEDTRVYMVGDINQLPPVHDRSVFGYALAKWPVFELTTIHRMADNPNGNHIIDQAWEILEGRHPQKGPGVMMVRVEGTDSRKAELRFKNLVVKAAEALKYDPQRDACIVAVNGQDISKRGANLGQIPLNGHFVSKFNPPDPDNSGSAVGRRVIVQAGYFRMHFAVGDKVMVTKNQRRMIDGKEKRLTNGMIGFITSIRSNDKYEAAEDFSNEELMNLSAIDLTKHKTLEAEYNHAGDHGSKEEMTEKDDDSYKQRAASHILTVDFGRDYDGNENIQDFATTGEVNSLVLAYAFTCHKSQGGEYETVIILCHSANHKVLCREWLYTAFTRAKQNVILVYNDRGLSQALRVQKVKGSTLEEKIASFRAWMSIGEHDMVAWLPEPVAT